MTIKRKRAIVGLLFILPWLIGFAFFYVRSIAMTLQFSMSDVVVGATSAGKGYTTSFNGIDNFLYLFREHATFNQIFTNSMMNMFIDVPLIIFFSLFIALLLNKKFPGRTLVRAIFFLPVILNSEAIQGSLQMARELMAGGVSATSTEMANAASSTTNVDFFMSIFMDIALPEKLVTYIIGAVGRLNDIVTLSGVQIVIFIAALQSVPSSLYEVAKIEGATGYETFWKVTFPMVTPHIITNLVYTVVDSFISSDIIKLSQDTAFTNMQYGYSSAMSVVSTVVICSALLIVCAMISKRTFYYN